MANIFGTSVSGLLATQRALATTGHNISNVNTEGYSRQRVDFSTRIPSGSSQGFIGTGVQTDSVRRVFDQSLETALQKNIAEFSRLDTLANFNGRVDNLLADKDAGVSPALQSFFDAVQDAANDPTSTSARQVLLSEAESLVSRFELVNQRLDELERDANNRIQLGVSEINELAGSIARLNQEIVQAQGRTGQPPNDLLDKRDQLIKQLSEKVGVTTVPESGGAINVFIGNGQALVVGNSTNQISAVRSQFDPNQFEIAYQRPGGGQVNITRNLTGGEVGGLLDFRREVLEPTRNDLGRLAATIATTFNEQHRLGMQFESTPPGLGQDFFSLPGPQVLPSQNNSAGVGSPIVDFDAATISDLTGSDYRLTFDNGDWTLLRLRDNTSQVVDDSGPQVIDGLSIDVSGLGAADGDSFLLRPTKQSSARIDVNLQRPGQIALANPLTGGEVTTASGQAINTGSGQLDRISVSAFDPDQLDNFRADGPLTFTFDAAASAFQVTDANGAAVASIDYDPATQGNGINAEVETAEFGTFSLRLSGVPADGDAFEVKANDNGVGDNANALQLAELANEGTAQGGAATYQEFYGSIVGRVGTETLRAQSNRDAQEALVDQARQARESVSGVNLEEEAAKLLQFQQAFQANAQVITVANDVFQTLLGAIQR
ncbi:flagellar hook-associated protein 1 FlgK [Natronocella acetinitrilica]|uniref:Flagellar hook-associated protein 1 n=1 Tax=Natronocella acetinitrilica TaxID=414046 RepID=A0AAE3G4F5_9GAMM|nr:flagellar hook-associated protein FlgK [Natronocella acetinitrilica]MCP1675615.1 flagellar hook-associated protein 1 FlgK [Natronocella acetinitrilica]